MVLLFEYSKTCIQRPPKGSNKSSLLQQLVFQCRFYLVDGRKAVERERWSPKVVDCLIQVVANTGLTVLEIWTSCKLGLGELKEQAR